MIDGIVTPALRDIDYLAPAAPYPVIPSGITVHQSTLYRYAIPTDEQPTLTILNYIPDYTAEENKEAMLAELDSVKTGQVTYAVRDTEIDGMQIRQNDYMGIGDKAILAVGTDLKETTMKMIDAMVDEDSAIVSIYYGADETEEHAQEIGKMIEEKYPDVEVEINCGGQPIYYFVISVE